RCRMRHTLLALLLSMVPALASGHASGLACNLGAMTKDERAQHAALAAELFGAIQERKELPNGYALRLPPGGWLDAARWAELEKKCCPFFAFSLTAGPGQGPLWLEISGGPGVKEFMKQEFRL